MIIKYFSYFLLIHWPIIDLYHLGYGRIERQIERDRKFGANVSWGEGGGGIRS